MYLELNHLSSGLYTVGRRPDVKWVVGFKRDIISRFLEKRRREERKEGEDREACHYEWTREGDVGQWQYAGRGVADAAIQRRPASAAQCFRARGSLQCQIRIRAKLVDQSTLTRYRIKSPLSHYLRSSSS